MKTPFQALQLASLPGQNVLINGNFDFWQRGISFAGISNASYGADRFQYGKIGSMVHTVSRDTSVPTFAQSGFQSQYSSKSLITTAQVSIAAGDYCAHLYKIEGYDYAPLHGKPCRLQFWVRNSIVGTYSVAIKNAANTRSLICTYTVNVADTWERKIIDFIADTNASYTFDNTAGLVFLFTLAAGTTFQTPTLNAWQTGNFLAANTQVNGVASIGANFQIAQLQIVQGVFTDALPFRRAGRNIQDELAMCQRYFEIWRPSDAFGHFGLVGITATNSGIVYYTYKVSKRVRPTGAGYTGTYQFLGASGTWTSFAFISDGQSTEIAAISMAGTGFTGNTAGLIRAANDLTASFYFDAEL